MWFKAFHEPHINFSKKAYSLFACVLKRDIFQFSEGTKRSSKIMVICKAVSLLRNAEVHTTHCALTEMLWLLPVDCRADLAPCSSFREDGPVDTPILKSYVRTYTVGNFSALVWSALSSFTFSVVANSGKCYKAQGDLLYSSTSGSISERAAYAT